MFRSKSLKKYISIAQKNQSTAQDDIFMKPDSTKVVGMRHGSYDKLNDKGYVPEETMIYNGDIILGKVSPIANVTDTSKQFKDSSEVYKSHAPAVIDKVYPDIHNQDGYEIRKVVIRSERTPMIGDKMCCYSEDHDVLTTEGWIPVNKITLEHKVATLIDGKHVEYQKPKRIYDYDCDDDVYIVESNQVSLRVTKNHRMYVKSRSGGFKVETAEDIYGKRRKYLKNAEDYIPENSINTFTLPATDKLPKKELDLDAWLIFFGIWMAEGCADKTRCVQFAANKQRVKDKLDRVCEILGFKINKNRDHKLDDDFHKWSIRDKQLTEYMIPFSVGSVNKQLPEWVWQLNKEQCRILIKGMMLGDGHTMANGTRRYDTSSTKLADQFQRLCLHAGYSTNKRMKCDTGYSTTIKSGHRAGTVVTATVPAWRLTIIESQNEPLVNKNLPDIQLDRFEKYTGKVYCCEMDNKDGIIYVRRDGMPVWCGQSRMGQKGTIGILLPSIDMPFNKHGTRPDIILNPNAIPSRQTVGQLLESLVGKVAALDCREGDGTPFENIDMSYVEKRLEELGFDSHGYEELYNGMTGEKLKFKIFMGVNYYQRLKHMVQDKLHGRARGPRTLLTRQPPEGEVSPLSICKRGG
jgi:hypothetical protein